LGGFDLNQFIGNAAPEGESRPGDLVACLQYTEDDIPEAAYARLEDRLAAGPDPCPFLEGLCFLHRNEHADALASFERTITDWPLATNPRLYYAIAGYESAPPLDSEVSYKRDFYLQTLIHGLDTPESRVLAGLAETLAFVASGEMFTATSRLAELEELGTDGFYLADLLFIKCYAGLGRNDATVQAVERRRDICYVRYPRLKELGGELYRIHAGQ